MDPSLPAVLLMGGGEGMGPVKKTAKALGESLFDEELGKPIGQLIIICGRNKDLASTLESLEWKIPVQVILFSWFVNFFLFVIVRTTSLNVNFHELSQCFAVHYRLEVLRSRWRNGWVLVIV